MTIPKSTTHFDYINCEFYKEENGKTYKFNGYGWSEVFNINLSGFVSL